jgi:hypothetical protein
LAHDGNIQEAAPMIERFTVSRGSAEVGMSAYGTKQTIWMSVVRSGFDSKPDVTDSNREDRV